MPTGYTHKVKDGISFEEFALGCARAFGALVMMRDEPSDAPIPEQFKPSTYYSDAIRDTETDLANLRALTPEAAEEAAKADFKKRMDAYFERANERNDLETKYREKLNEVNAWVVPSPDHQGLKDFMVEQLTESIKFDCDGSYDPVPVAKDGPTWVAEQITVLEARLNHTKEHEAAEIERTDARNKWVRDLRESLETKTDE